MPHGVVTNDYNTWQPRMGFADDLYGHGKTILRGGFGTFYERLQGNDIYGLSNSNLPCEYTPVAGSVYYSKPTCSWESTAATSNPANCGSPTTLPIYPASLTTLATTYKAPGAAMYSLGVQHELQPSVIAVVQYVGNLGWHQNVDIPINNFPLTTSNSIFDPSRLPVRCRARFIRPDRISCAPTRDMARLPRKRTHKQHLQRSAGQPASPEQMGPER